MPYFILNRDTNRVIEGHSDRFKAYKARDIVNDHEERNGRPRVYSVLELSENQVSQAKRDAKICGCKKCLACSILGAPC